jgi:hypothetical protein
MSCEKFYVKKRSLSVVDVPSEDRVAIEAVLAGHQDMRRRKSLAMSIDSGIAARVRGRADMALR